MVPFGSSVCLRFSCRLLNEFGNIIPFGYKYTDKALDIKNTLEYQVILSLTLSPMDFCSPFFYGAHVLQLRTIVVLEFLHFLHGFRSQQEALILQYLG